MKKILFTIFIMLISTSVFALENITINNDNLIPSFDKSLRKYNYFTNSDKILINVRSNDDEIINGDGVFELNSEENKFIINSNIDGEYIITVYKDYKKKESVFGNLIDLKIEGYDINFNSEVYEYDITINDEDRLNIDYELLNDSSYVSITGNGNFNKEKNIITINVDDINTYTINVYKTVPVSNIIEVKEEVKQMSYIEKEIVKIIIITISCTIIFILFHLLFLRKSTLHA